MDTLVELLDEEINGVESIDEESRGPMRSTASVFASASSVGG